MNSSQHNLRSLQFDLQMFNLHKRPQLHCMWTWILPQLNLFNVLSLSISLHRMLTYVNKLHTLSLRSAFLPRYFSWFMQTLPPQSHKLSQVRHDRNPMLWLQFHGIVLWPNNIKMSQLWVSMFGVPFQHWMSVMWQLQSLSGHWNSQLQALLRLHASLQYLSPGECVYSLRNQQHFLLDIPSQYFFINLAACWTC